MKNYATRGLAVLCVLITVSAASAQTPFSPDAKSLIGGSTAFALDLYAKLKDTQGNVFFSPYGVSSTLAMTYAGAHGDTADQIAQALCFKLEKEKLHPAFFELNTDIEELQQKGNVELIIANSLWPQKGHPVLKKYLDILHVNYTATVTPLDYQRETKAARLEINKCVEDNTQGKIKELIPPDFLERTTRFVLANTVYFKGNWASPFKRELTKPAPFQFTSGKSEQIPMMNQENSFGYGEFDNVQVLELPYAGNDFAMIVLLPKKMDGLAELESSLTTENIRKWTGKLGKVKIDVSLPKFKADFQFEAGAHLRAMGMTDAFDQGKADFSEMTSNKEGLYVSYVISKAIIEVDEEGTVAASGAAVIIAKDGVRIPTFRADHPFLFLIRLNRSRTILFLGRVVAPTT